MSNLPPPPPPEDSAFSFLADPKGAAPESAAAASAEDASAPVDPLAPPPPEKKSKAKERAEAKGNSNRRLLWIGGGTIAALVLVGVAAVLFWPQGERERVEHAAVIKPLVEENVPAVPARLDDLGAGAKPFSGSLSLVRDTVLQQAQAFDNAALDGDTLAGLGRQRDERQGDSGPVAREVVPKAQRWEIRWPPTSSEQYAQQLDFFGIELAALGGGVATIDYGSKLGEKQPVLRSQPAGTPDNRLYFAHRASSKRLDVDRMLLSSAGVNVHDRIILQFLPFPVEEDLTKLEREFTGAKKLEDVLKTIFGVRQGGKGFEFYVIEQRMRGAG